MSELVTGARKIIQAINGELNDDMFAVAREPDHGVIAKELDAENRVGIVALPKLLFGAAKHVTEPSSERPVAMMITYWLGSNEQVRFDLDSISQNASMSGITIVITQHEKQTYYKQATCRVFGFITLFKQDALAA